MADKYGFWIRTRLDKTHYRYSCSCCGKSSRFYKFLFCPYCGTRIVEDYVEEGKKS